MRGIVRAALVAAAMALMAAWLFAAPRAAAAFRNVQGGMEAPAFRLRDLEGGEVSLEALRGHRAVIVVFFATWSGRSLEELKDVQALVAEHGGRGLRAVAVNVDHEHLSAEDVRAVKAKALELGLSFPVVLDEGLETFRAYGVVAVPSTAVLGEGGVLRAAFNGYPTSTRLELREAVEDLLGVARREVAPAAATAPAYKPARAALLNYNLGRRLHDAGMDEKAEGRLRAAAAADPGWAPPRILLGEIALRRCAADPGAAREAKKEFEAAAAADPGSAAARAGLARADLELGLLDEAEKEVAAALAASPSYTPALLVRARIAARRKDAAQMEKALQAALELAPQDARVHALAALAYEEASDLAKAAAAYRRAWALWGP